jgi:predicted transcriptional regulator
VTDLAADVDRATSTVSSHVCELTDAGVLVRERDGRTVRVRLSEETRAFLSDRDAGGGPSRSARRDVSPE